MEIPEKDRDEEKSHEPEKHHEHEKSHEPEKTFETVGTLNDSSNKEITKRRDKITKWIKKHHSITFLTILVFAIIIRLYYFYLTKDQPLWWDEAEYMNMARAWAFNLDFTFYPVRPILFSLITAVLFKFAEFEILPRLIILFLSIGSVIGMYYLGKEIYNEYVGLISSFLMSVFYLILFHTGRLLVDVPSITFYIFSAFFFYIYFRDNNPKMLYIGAVIIGVGTLFRVTTATFLFTAAIYVIVTEKLNFIKKKEVWIASLIFILILTPYIIWGYVNFHGFVISQAGAWNAPKDGQYFSNGIGNLSSYIFTLIPFMLGTPLLIVFVLGLFLTYELFLGFDLLIKGKDFNLNKSFYLLLLLIIPILTVSFSLANVPEDRYIINAVPAIFIFSAVFLTKTYNTFKKNGKYIAFIIILIFLAYVAYLQLNIADQMIKQKKESFIFLKQAGLWMRENTDSSSTFIASGHPMLMYYSHRSGRGFPDTEEEFIELKASNPRLDYFLVTHPAIQPGNPQWSFSYPERNNLTVGTAYTSQDQPLLVIYEL